MNTGRDDIGYNANFTHSLWQGVTSTAASTMATPTVEEVKPVANTVTVQQFVQAATTEGNSHFDEVCELFKGMQLGAQFRQQTIVQANIIAERVEADLAQMHAIQPASTPQEQERRCLIAYVIQAYVRCLELDVDKWKAKLEEKNLSTEIHVIIKNIFQPWEKRQASIPAYQASQLQQPANMTPFAQIGFVQLALNYWRSSYEYMREYEKLLNCEPYSKEQELWRYEQITLCYFAAAGHEAPADLNGCRMPEPVNAQPANASGLSMAAIRSTIEAHDQRVQLRR